MTVGNPVRPLTLTSGWPRWHSLGSEYPRESPRVSSMHQPAAMPTADRAFRWNGPFGLVVLAVAACGGSTRGLSSGTDSGTDARGDASPGDDISDAAIPDSYADAGSGDAGYLACMSASGQLDGSLKTCQSDTDCVIKQEQTDCCGTILYVGVSSASAATYDACEAAWVGHFPGCGCDSNKTTTEDGKMTSPAVDGGGPEVHCTDFTMSGGVCMTYTP